MEVQKQIKENASEVNDFLKVYFFLPTELQASALTTHQLNSTRRFLHPLVN